MRITVKSLSTKKLFIIGIIELFDYTNTPRFSNRNENRLDIKMLERILQKEKKIAESVHQTLEAIADRSDIDMMVGLTSGSSDEWKLILKASYEIPERRMQRFHRAIIDLQYDHMVFDLMLSLEGDREFYTLKRA